MKQGLREIIKDVTPPFLLRRMKALSSSGSGVQREEEGQKGAEWYDATFESSEHWRLHYSESQYYFLWTVIADRIMRHRPASVLEIGCGSGQLACLMRDKGITQYHGFDFSAKRVEQARKVCPEFEFSTEDAFQTDLFNACEYDTVICTEFLEHVERDLEVLARIRKGTRFHGTVPNFAFTSHVRHFRNEAEVRSRYSQFLEDLKVDSFLANPKGKVFYLLEGTTR